MTENCITGDLYLDDIGRLRIDQCGARMVNDQTNHVITATNPGDPSPQVTQQRIFFWDRLDYRLGDCVTVDLANGFFNIQETGLYHVEAAHGDNALPNPQGNVGATIGLYIVSFNQGVLFQDRDTRDKASVHFLYCGGDIELTAGDRLRLDYLVEYCPNPALPTCGRSVHRLIPSRGNHFTIRKIPN